MNSSSHQNRSPLSCYLHCPVWLWDMDSTQAPWKAASPFTSHASKHSSAAIGKTNSATQKFFKEQVYLASLPWRGIPNQMGKAWYMHAKWLSTKAAALAAPQSSLQQAFSWQPMQEMLGQPQDLLGGLLSKDSVLVEDCCWSLNIS